MPSTCDSHITHSLVFQWKVVCLLGCVGIQTEHPHSHEICQPYSELGWEKVIETEIADLFLELAASRAVILILVTWNKPVGQDLTILTCFRSVTCCPGVW